MLLDISCYFPGAEGMGRKLGTNVVMSEPQLLYNRYLKSTQMEKVGLFSQGPLAPSVLRRHSSREMPVSLPLQGILAEISALKKARPKVP